MRSCQRTVLTIAILYECTSGQGKHTGEGRRSLCSRPPWSAGTPASLCAHTAVTFSGITKESAFLIEIPGKIKCENLCQVDSVSPVTSRVCLLFVAALVQSVPKRFTLQATSVALAEIVIRYIFKNSAAIIPDGLRSILG